jgi:hypothetical protein
MAKASAQNAKLARADIPALRYFLIGIIIHVTGRNTT